jgi:hypothetical protein
MLLALLTLLAGCAALVMSEAWGGKVDCAKPGACTADGTPVPYSFCLLEVGTTVAAHARRWYYARSEPALGVALVEELRGLGVIDTEAEPSVEWGQDGVGDLGLPKYALRLGLGPFAGVYSFGIIPGERPHSELFGLWAVWIEYGNETFKCLPEHIHPLRDKTEVGRPDGVSRTRFRE